MGILYVGTPHMSNNRLFSQQLSLLLAPNQAASCSGKMALSMQTQSSQSVNWERRLARSASRCPTVC